MSRRVQVTAAALVGLLAVASAARAAQNEKEDAAIASVRESAQQVAKSFNAGKADEVAAAFLDAGELIDEQGVVHQGQPQIQELLSAFFTQFPGAKLALDIESIRLVGPVAIDEGTRTMTTADGELRSRFRYIAVWAKSGDGWRLASFRDFADDPVPTPHDNLQPLAFLVGDWINEGTDGKVAITYRWSDDKNYLLGEFEVSPVAGQGRKSTQRIGWDPAAGRIRTWLFDSDGGFAEGVGTIIDDGALIKSASVNPDGTTSSATLEITMQDADHFTIAGSDRIVGGILEEDFEITVTRRPPQARN
jgi:uncharacterized protein (TIGR02246 family)